MKKILVIPKDLDIFGASVSNLLLSDAFSKLRCGFSKDLSGEEISFLRKGFEQFCVLSETKQDKVYFVEEDEEITVEMMLEASYSLTRSEINSENREHD